MNPVCITNGGIWAGLNITPPCLCCVKSLRIRRMCDVAPRTTHGVVAHCSMPEHHAARHNVAASLGMTKAPRTCPPPTWFFCMSLMAICGGLSREPRETEGQCRDSHERGARDAAPCSFSDSSCPRGRRFDRLGRRTSLRGEGLRAAVSEVAWRRRAKVYALRRCGEVRRCAGSARKCEVRR